MHFQRTTDSLFPFVSQMTITHEHAIAELLITYEQQLEEDTLPDRGLVEQAYTLLVERLNTIPLDTELALLGHYLYLEKGAFDECALFLRRYLALPHSLDEEAWARWHLVDALALARHCLETAQEQKQLLQFTLQHFLVEQCLFVMSDSTQARCWEASGQAEQWMALVESLLHQVEPSQDTRADRFYVLRTASYICLSVQKTEQVQHYIQMIRALMNEDSQWAENKRYFVESSLIDLKIHDEAADMEGVRRVGQDVTHHIMAWEAELQGLPFEDERVRRYRTLCHNTAAPLYRAKHYDLAIPLFRCAIAYGTMPYEPFLWLAASLWASTKRREEVVPLLSQAAQRYNDGGEPWQHFRTLPEFHEVQNDPQFEHASRVVFATR